MKTALDPMIAKLNELVEATFPPKQIVNGMKCGAQIYYYGTLPTLGANGFTEDKYHQWILDGMTPISIRSVLKYLKLAGRDVSEFEAYLKAQEDERYAAFIKVSQLRASAKAKLTEEEANACGL